MNYLMKGSLLVVVLLVGGAAWGAPQRVALAVKNMTCSACPITVKKSLEKVAGVEKVSINFETKEATVTYDDAKTSPDALTKATTNAGYPSTVKAGPLR